MKKIVKLSLITLLTMLIALCAFLSIIAISTKAETTNYRTDTFKLVDGAYIRPISPKGIRFEAGISKGEKTELPEGTTFGMIITLDSYLNEKELNHSANVKLVDIPTNVWLSTSSSAFGEEYAGYYSTMISGSSSNAADIESQYYTTIFVARGYINIDGEYIYTPNTVIRSIAGVAEMTVETADEETDQELLTYARQIVEVSEKINFSVDNQNGEEITSKRVVIGSILNDLDIPEQPTRDGYTFTGWFKDSDCTEEFEFNGILKEDTTIYAGWEKSETEEQNFTYDLYNGVLRITGYIGTETNVVIPNIIDGKSVNIIGEGAFSGYSNLEQVQISDSVIAIWTRAFENCTGLESVIIGKGITSIADKAFFNCVSLKEISFNATEFGNNSSTLNSQIFTNAGQSGGGIRVTIGSNVKNIPQKLFYSNESSTAPKIINLTFEKNSICESIGERAFYNCSSLKNIEIPENITSIGKSAFQGCTELIEINYNAVACSDFSQENYVFEKAGNNGTGITVLIGEKVTKIPAYMFSLYYGDYVQPKITNVVFAKNSICKTIGVCAFSRCVDLENIEIPSSVESIGESAFYNCSSLNNIEIPENIKNIERNAFASCSNLKTITFGENSKLESIGEISFSSCVNLSSISIPTTVTSIGSGAFYDSSSLTSINYEGTKEQWEAIIKGDSWNYNTGTYIVYCTNGNITKN